MDDLMIARERAEATNNLCREARQTELRLRGVTRVAYSSCGDAGIRAGVYDSGELLDVSPSEDGTTVIARVLFDGRDSPEYLDARLLQVLPQ